MTQMISLTKKPAAREIDGRKGQVIKALAKLDADKKAVDLERVKKSLARTFTEKNVRTHIRDLRDAKMVTVKRIKAA